MAQTNKTATEKATEKKKTDMEKALERAKKVFPKAGIVKGEDGVERLVLDITKVKSE